METNFNFNSKVCTSREQSEKLLALGLKKGTADMHWFYTGKIHGWQCSVQCYQDAIAEPFRKEDATNGNIQPAWGLHRLIEMCPPNMRGYMCKNIFDEKYAIDEQFDELIATIGYYIKEGYFNKEYLV